VEHALKALRGVVEVKARLMDKDLGEAAIIYEPTEIALQEIQDAISLASGERHEFTVISVIEGG